jgi:hypothetical protein
MKAFALFILVFSTAFLYAQKRPEAIKVTYSESSNGKGITADPIVIYSDAAQTVITKASIVENKASFPYEQSYLSRKNGLFTHLAQLSKEKGAMTVDTTAVSKQIFEILDETKTILGYRCEKAKTVINSNTIELWFTNELKLKGSPSVLGQNLGLVLEMTRNGNYTISAEKIEELQGIPTLIPQKKPKQVDLLTYRDILWKSRFITVPVFKDEIINFSDASRSDDSVLRFANGTIIVRKVKFPQIKNTNQIFIDVTQQSNGDAYDRMGSVFIIPTDKKQSFLDGLKTTAKELPVYENGNGKQYQGVVRTNDYAPLLELMRFFTPFGIGKYNDAIKLKNKVWLDSVHFRQDISEIQPVLSGKEMWIGANIGNYDKGGHKVSVNITIHPEEEGHTAANFVLPLFNTNNVMEMAGQEYATMFNSDKGLEVRFTVSQQLKYARLRYITTGHGGWENGDEFLQKTNTILLDGKPVFAFVPWRMDCGSYRSYNPASGNFDNGLSSSDYSRSNWCPGTVTNPIYIDLGDLAIGEHTITIKIPQGEPEGNSFSSWNVSGVLIGEREK